MTEHQFSPPGLFARGCCMGVADVIPGVSGGTMALILGIYRPLIEAIRSVRLDLPALAVGAIRDRQPFLEALREIHWRFLVPLIAGIGCAGIAGSLVIPGLLESHPEEMRGLFFGLILASISAPIALMERRSGKAIGIAVLMAVLAGVAGYSLTDPAAELDTTSEWVEVEIAERTSYKHALRRGPAGKTSGKVFWNDKNKSLQDAIEASDPALFAKLKAAKDAGDNAADKRAQKAQAQLYELVQVPAGTTLHCPRPAFWFMFFAGMIAICAMVLPGISGSFLLLVMGVYFFVLNAVKGSLHQLKAGELPVDSLIFIALFGAGIIFGITVFSRILSWLLHRFPDPTMGALVGLMIGCLRGVWPWRTGQSVNFLPDSGKGAALGAMAIGIAVVIVLQLADRKMRPGDSS